MKKILISIAFLASVTVCSLAQITEGFDGIPVDSNSFIIGSDYADTLYKGIATITSDYDTAWQYWSGGFALSNLKDSSTSGYTNLYGCKGYKGFGGSPIFLVGQNFSNIKIRKEQYGNYFNNLKGFYINNSTYAYNSMLYGDQFAKKFGGASGNEPDYFSITIKGFNQGQALNDTVVFYLADYRYSDNTKDYIIKEWTWVDLTSLANADEITFTLSSSDIGTFGMNTPAFFCIDQFTYEDYGQANLNANTFDNIITSSDSVLDKFNENRFFSNALEFNNTFDTAWNYWSAGWAVSSITDNTTPGYTNLYSAITGSGYLSSSYAVGQNNATINNTSGGLTGFYVTNSTYAYYSMLNGDQFAKKFGGVSGNDPDYFKIKITRTEWHDSTPDTVEFFLADFRFNNNEQDYIIKDWTWVDLTKLKLIDEGPGDIVYSGSYKIEFSSSDTGSFGINTPMFVCIDGLVKTDYPLGIKSASKVSDQNISLYPNPSFGIIHIKSDDEIQNIDVLSMDGRLIQNFGQTKSIDLTYLNSGAYLIRVNTNSETSIHRLIKQ
jgi:hypothetical protein